MMNRVLIDGHIEITDTLSLDANNQQKMLRASSPEHFYWNHFFI